VPRGRRRRTPKWHTSSHTHAPSECRVSLPDSHPHLTDSHTGWSLALFSGWWEFLHANSRHMTLRARRASIRRPATPPASHTRPRHAQRRTQRSHAAGEAPLSTAAGPLPARCTHPHPAPTFVASRPTHPTHDLFAVMFDRLSKLDLGSAHRHTNRDVLWVGEEHPHVCVRRVCASQLRASW
jgi:hypothetical protein